MTFIDAMVRNKLLNTPGVTDLVGTRIYSTRLPREADLPAIVVKLVDVVPDMWVPDAQQARVQVSVFSLCEESENERSPKESRLVETAVKTALHVAGLDGINTTWTIGSTTYSILTCYLSLITAFVEADTNYYNVPMDFIIEYRS